MSPHWTELTSIILDVVLAGFRHRLWNAYLDDPRYKVMKLVKAYRAQLKDVH